MQHRCTIDARNAHVIPPASSPLCTPLVLRIMFTYTSCLDDYIFPPYLHALVRITRKFLLMLYSFNFSPCFGIHTPLFIPQTDTAAQVDQFEHPDQPDQRRPPCTMRGPIPCLLHEGATKVKIIGGCNPYYSLCFLVYLNASLDPATPSTFVRRGVNVALLAWTAGTDGLLDDPLGQVCTTGRACVV